MPPKRWLRKWLLPSSLNTYPSSLWNVWPCTSSLMHVWLRHDMNESTQAMRETWYRRMSSEPFTTGNCMQGGCMLRPESDCIPSEVVATVSSEGRLDRFDEFVNRVVSELHCDDRLRECWRKSTWQVVLARCLGPGRIVTWSELSQSASPGYEGARPWYRVPDRSHLSSHTSP